MMDLVRALRRRRHLLLVRTNWPARFHVGARQSVVPLQWPRDFRRIVSARPPRSTTTAASRPGSLSWGRPVGREVACRTSGTPDSTWDDLRNRSLSVLIQGEPQGPRPWTIALMNLEAKSVC